ncbi:MAG: hypothetical protein Q8T13_17265 [Acidobacteriota bacterium]|nr:hypothetical protein [Acidobacteriota bacterium]
MSVLANYLRERTADDVRQMEPAARLDLALRLGDDDLALYCEAAGIDLDEGRKRVMRQRQSGRRPSASAER